MRSPCCTPHARTYVPSHAHLLTATAPAVFQSPSSNQASRLQEALSLLGVPQKIAYLPPDHLVYRGVVYSFTYPPIHEGLDGLAVSVAEHTAMDMPPHGRGETNGKFCFSFTPEVAGDACWRGSERIMRWSIALVHDKIVIGRDHTSEKQSYPVRHNSRRSRSLTWGPGRAGRG